MTSPTTTDRIAVLTAIDAFCAMATEHPETPANYGFEPDRPGQKYTRIIMTADGKRQSVHAFVDNFTGDLYMAAGWKAPAKGIRGNVLDLDEIAARFYWAGSYLYKQR